ncbi:hypothetical protein EYF80_059182 [Liparis tanakae]|uniref:Uncharacterized protein n=1 Tax=Liparis tanakae TaxID=230148 RepID=A0A4Z2EQL3_9TELE|nr:hypothetical protein EYF80_059182 [Liparis tanakae]
MTEEHHNNSREKLQPDPSTSRLVLSGSGSGSGSVSGAVGKGSDRGRSLWGSSSQQRDPGGVSMAGGGGAAGSRSSRGSRVSRGSGGSHGSEGSGGRGGALQNPVSSLRSSAAAVTLTASCGEKPQGGAQDAPS